MNDEQAPQPDTNPSNPIIPATSTSEYVDEAETDQKHSSTQQEPCTYKQHPPVNVKVDLHESKGKSYWSNGIQIAAVIANLFMVVLTYQLLRETKESVGIANNALSDSRIIAAENRQRDLLQDTVDRLRDDRNRIKDSLTIALASRSLDAQIGTIKEARRQFDITNQPYFTLGDLVIRRFTKDQRIFEFKVANVGKFPANVIGTQYRSAFGKPSYIDSLILMRRRLKNINTIISPSINLIPVTVDEKVPLNENDFQDIVSDRLSYYLGYFIHFTNLVDSIKYEQIIILKISASGGSNITEVNTIKRLY